MEIENVKRWGSEAIEGQKNKRRKDEIKDAIRGIIKKNGGNNKTIIIRTAKTEINRLIVNTINWICNYAMHINIAPNNQT